METSPINQSLPNSLPQSLPLIDWTYIDNIVDGSEEFKQELLQTFVESMATSLEQLEKAIAETNYQDIQQIGHFIKGSSINLGIKSIAAIAAELEQIGRDRKSDNMESLFLSMQSLFIQIQNYL